MNIMGRFLVVPIAVFLLICCWAAATEAKYMKYRDARQPVSVRIKDLMSKMTLAEKIGQMTQIERSVATPDVMKKYFIGNVNRSACFALIFFSSVCPLEKVCNFLAH